MRSSEISYADVRVSPIARLMKRWPVFVVAGSCRPELPLFVYRSGQEELFRELLPEFRMPPDTRHDLTHRSAVFFAPAGIPFGLCLLLVLVSRSVLPALTGTLLIPTAVFAVFLAGGLMGWLKEGIWLREGRFTLRRQKGVYLHWHLCVPPGCLPAHLPIALGGTLSAHDADAGSARAGTAQGAQHPRAGRCALSQRFGTENIKQKEV